MTLTLELAPDDQRELEEAARREGQSIADYAARLLHEAAQARRSEIAAKLAALDAIPVYNTRAGLPEIENTSRNAEPDIYGYDEQETAQLS